jgi:hypothetical protein
VHHIRNTPRHHSPPLQMRSRLSPPRTRAQNLDLIQDFLLLTPDLPVAQRHPFELPVHTAFDAGEVALGGTMELWIAGVERIVMEAIFQKHLGRLYERAWQYGAQRPRAS